MTTLKTGSTLTTGTAGGDTQAGFLVTFNASHPAAQVGIGTTDFINAPIFVIADASNGAAVCYGDEFGAYKTVLTDSSMSIATGVGGDPPALRWPNGTSAQGIKVWSGSGAPSGSTVSTGRVGDLYWRTDTPSTSNQRLYRCTVAGTPGTWAGIL